MKVVQSCILSGGTLLERPMTSACVGLTVFAADIIAMSERILTGAVKVSDRRATRQIIPKEATNAVLVLARRASTEVRISRGLCQRV